MSILGCSCARNECGFNVHIFFQTENAFSVDSGHANLNTIKQDIHLVQNVCMHGVSVKPPDEIIPAFCHRYVALWHTILHTELILTLVHKILCGGSKLFRGAYARVCLKCWYTSKYATWTQFVLTESTISDPWRSNDSRPSPDFLHSCEIKLGVARGQG